MGKHIFTQVIGDEAMSATDDQLIRPREAPLEGQRHQLEASDPTFQLGLQRHDFIVAEIEPHQIDSRNPLVSSSKNCRSSARNSSNSWRAR